jgi:hypothetical protein
MTHRYALYSLTMALTTLASCSSPDVTRGVAPTAPRLDRTSAPAIHQVTGGGKLDISNFDPALPPETYAFTASVDGNGDVKGQMQIRFSDPLVSLHAEVTCLAVSDRDAWIGIVVTRTDDSAVMPVGAERWVRVQDNGEGASAAPDRMGFFLPGGGAARCNEQRPVGMPFAWLHGNIQVR